MRHGGFGQSASGLFRGRKPVRLHRGAPGVSYALNRHSGLTRPRRALRYLRTCSPRDLLSWGAPSGARRIGPRGVIPLGEHDGPRTCRQASSRFFRRARPLPTRQGRLRASPSELPRGQAVQRDLRRNAAPGAGPPSRIPQETAARPASCICRTRTRAPAILVSAWSNAANRSRPSWERRRLAGMRAKRART